MKRPCETCIAVADLTDGRKGRCRWCAAGLPPYDPDATDAARAARRQLALAIEATTKPEPPDRRTTTEEKTAR